MSEWILKNEIKFLSFLHSSKQLRRSTSSPREMRKICLSILVFMFAYYARSEWDDFKSDFIEDNVSTNSSNVTNFCSQSVCFIDSARVLKWIDSSVELCQSFYNFTCGSFMKFVSFSFQITKLFSSSSFSHLFS